MYQLEVYGYQDNNLTEDCPLMPRSPYAASKAGADRMAYSYYTTYDMNLCIVRPFNVFGPGQKDGECGAVIPRWTTDLLNQRNITIYGDGNQSREFIHIADLVKAYKKIIDIMLNNNKLAGQVINVGTGIDVTVKELAKKLTTNMHGAIKYGPSRPGEVKRFISNSDKMKSLGWKPEVSLDQGIENYLQWRKSLFDLESIESFQMELI